MHPSEPSRATARLRTPRRAGARAALVASAVALLPLLVACGGDDDARATGTNAPASVDSPGGAPAAGGGAPAAGGATDGRARIAFARPADGDRIAGSVEVVMTADGVEIEEAGEVREGAGHLHVATEGQCVTAGEAIPRDPTHVHFGKGQLEDRLYLPAGTHELCLQVGDGGHIAQPITSQVTVTVGVETAEEWCAVSNEIDSFDVYEGDPDATIEELHSAASKAAALADQLQHRVDLVDAGARDDVSAMIDHFLALTTTLTGSPDAETARERAAELMEDVPLPVIDGSEWVDESCAAG